MSEEQDLVSKRNTTSAVWQYFGFIPDEEGRRKDDDKPVCNRVLARNFCKKGTRAEIF